MKVKIKSNNSLALNNLGLIYKNSKRFNQAKQTFLKLIQSDSTNADGYYGIAEVYLAQELYDSTIIYANKAFKLWEQKSRIYACDALEYIGKAYLKKGNNSKAKETYLNAQSLGYVIPFDIKNMLDIK